MSGLWSSEERSSHINVLEFEDMVNAVPLETNPVSNWSIGSHSTVSDDPVLCPG